MAHLTHPNVVHEFIERQSSRRVLQTGVCDCAFAVWVTPPREHAVIDVIPFKQIAAYLCCHKDI